jgi:signal peptidase I
MTSRDAESAATGGGWFGVLAMSISRSYLILIAALAAAAIVPGAFGWSASVVQSESMAPHISTGDVVLAAELEAASAIPVGGVVTFTVDDRTVVHRIVALNDDNTIVTAGDANSQYDSWSITRADITGQARLLVPYVGLPGLWLQRHEYLLLVAWGIITLAAVTLAIPRGGPRTGGGRRRRGTNPPVTLARVAAGVLATGLISASFVSFPTASVEAAFTGTTKSSSLWKAQSYSPITTGAMAGFGAIASSSIQDTSSIFSQSTIAGDAATTPGTSIIGFWDYEIDSTHTNDQTAKNAMAAAVAVRAALLERPVTRTLPAALSGTLNGGVYTSTTGAFSLAGTLTLDARGDSSARFVFRTTTTLSMAQRARVVLVNGAQAANIWWVVGTSATLGTTTTIFPDTTAVGNYLVGTNATLRGVTLSGRVVAYGGSVLLNGRIIPTN